MFELFSLNSSLTIGLNLLGNLDGDGDKTKALFITGKLMVKNEIFLLYQCNCCLILLCFAGWIAHLLAVSCKMA